MRLPKPYTPIPYFMTSPWEHLGRMFGPLGVCGTVAYLTADNIIIGGTELSLIYATKNEVGNNAQISTNTGDIAVLNTKQLQNFNDIIDIHTNLTNNYQTNTQLATNFYNKTEMDTTFFKKSWAMTWPVIKVH